LTKRASRSLKRRKEKIYEKGRQIIGDDVSRLPSDALYDRSIGYPG